MIAKYRLTAFSRLIRNSTNQFSTTSLKRLTKRQALIRDQYLAKCKDDSEYENFQQKHQEPYVRREPRHLVLFRQLLEESCATESKGDRSLSAEECQTLTTNAVSAESARAFHATFFSFCSKNNLKQTGLSFLQHLLANNGLPHIVAVGSAVNFLESCYEDLCKDDAKQMFIQLANLCGRYREPSLLLSLKCEMKALCFADEFRNAFEILSKLENNKTDTELLASSVTFGSATHTYYGYLLESAIRTRSVQGALQMLNKMFEKRVVLSDSAIEKLCAWCSEIASGRQQRNTITEADPCTAAVFNLSNLQSSDVYKDVSSATDDQAMIFSLLSSFREMETLVSKQAIDCLMNYFQSLGWSCAKTEGVRTSRKSGGNQTLQFDEADYDLPFSSTCRATAVQRIREGHKVLILMRGCPGSGKTTHAKRILDEANATESGLILSADDYFTTAQGQYKYEKEQLGKAHDWNLRRATEKMEKGLSPLIADNTNTVASEMKGYVLGAIENGYEIHFVEPPTDWKFDSLILFQKCQHSVPYDAIKRMLLRYDNSITLRSFLKWMKPKPDRSRGLCANCRKQLEPLSVTKDEVNFLAEKLEKYLKAKAFVNSTPKEIHAFENFLAKIPPCDLVVDSLNVANSGCSDVLLSQKAMLKRLLDFMDSLKSSVGFKNVLAISRRHIAFALNPGDYKKGLAQWFFLDDCSNDDLFILLGALKSSRAFIVTNDYFGDHRKIVFDNDPIFSRWYAARRIKVKWEELPASEQEQQSASSLSFEMPYPWRLRIQSSDNGSLHIPFDDGSTISASDLPNAWLCVSVKPVFETSCNKTCFEETSLRQRTEDNVSRLLDNTNSEDALSTIDGIEQRFRFAMVECRSRIGDDAENL